MKFIVKARHTTLTDQLTAHVHAKLERAVMHVFDDPAITLEVELEALEHARDGANMKCRATMTIPKAKTIVICETDDDMYKAIDLAHDRLLNQVNHVRDRQTKPTRTRKLAVRERAATARHNLTAEREPWEAEVQEFERSTARL